MPLRFAPARPWPHTHVPTEMARGSLPLRGQLFKKYLVPTAIFYSFLQLGMYQANVRSAHAICPGALVHPCHPCLLTPAHPVTRHTPHTPTLSPQPDNFLWFLWVRMICDLYCAYRLRLPAPWSFDNSKKEAERHAWDWYAEGTGPRVYGYGPPLGPP